MYEALDPRCASTGIGCVAIGLVPIPIVLKRYLALHCFMLNLTACCIASLGTALYYDAGQSSVQ